MPGTVPSTRGTICGANRVLIERDRIEAGNRVWRQVTGRGDFVQDLFADGVNAHESARSRMLGHHEAAVGLDFDQRETDVAEGLHQMPVGEIASCRLRSA